MSGAHSRHRTPSKPLVVEGAVVMKLDNRGRPVQVHRLVPLPFNANGRPVGYHAITSFATAHVLDYSPEFHRPSKHAAGRTRPRTAKEQRRARNLKARYVRASKNFCLLMQQMPQIDEVLAA